MSHVMTRPRPASARNVTRTLGPVFVVTVFVGAEAFALSAPRTPGFVDQVTIENPGVHNLEIDVGRDRLGLVPPPGRPRAPSSR